MKDKSRIRYLLMDVDGTLTDGKIYMGENGEMFKAFSIKDGYGIHDMLIPAGIKPVIITGRTSKIVARRCMELGIEAVFQGVGNKLAQLEKLLHDWAADMSECAYIGDDMNDLQIMEAISNAGGITGCPADAVIQIQKIADHVCNKIGGEGAVRDFIEYLLK